ncbi:hypothetical protein Enr13x_20380 [Stieleria neptunia]|uniref:Methyltransferase type 11 domain-containing protein n=1 Tax=Stieleria neptunia TaxID=2527979 RepID=A0A518HMW3_9BACT|nr:methyltransferase domain-containing protein [Stieleria neptunia]QDV42195.1 hypothetical protein Enr13x_20380 [Stieleria neptunia]
MRRQHLETFQPVCPVCRAATGQIHFLELATVIKEVDDHIVEGLLHCSNIQCQREYPIIDGVPLIIRDIRSYLSENVFQVCQRTDLSETIESVLGDCCGHGSTLDAIRQHISCYGWDHYGDLDPEESPVDPKPGSMLRVLQHGLELSELKSADLQTVLDVGCSVGRGTFALAEELDRPILGVDLNFPMLRIAAGALRDGVVRYPRRRVGVVYDRREFPVTFPSAHLVDFWACDATALPFVEQSVDAAFSMNLLDCVHSPMEFLAALGSVLKPGGSAVLACPYDWSSSATSMEGWLGGHSQRGPGAGASEPVLRQLLSPDHPQSLTTLRLVVEDNGPWHVRMHDRNVVSYDSHLVVAQKCS